MHYCECCVHHPFCNRGGISENEKRYPDAAFIILGDFNHCNLRKNIPKFYRSVTFSTK